MPGWGGVPGASGSGAQMGHDLEESVPRTVKPDLPPHPGAARLAALHLTLRPKQRLEFIRIDHGDPEFNRLVELGAGCIPGNHQVSFP